jgi:hypothetical protein
MTGLDGRKSGEFTGTERDVAGVVSDIFVSGIFLSTIVIPVRALRTGHDCSPAGTLGPAG